jgi:hypothetical protein
MLSDMLRSKILYIALAIFPVIVVCGQHGKKEQLETKSSFGKKEQLGKKSSFGKKKIAKKKTTISLGPRPYYLVDSMESSELKNKLGM